MEPWQEKAEKARTLIEQIKIAKNNVSSAEEAMKLRKQFDDARKLAQEAHTERTSLEKARLDEVLGEFENEKASEEKRTASSEMYRIAPPTSDGRSMTASGRMQTLGERMRADKARVMYTERAVKSIPDLHQAALAEGTGSSGGYLVVPQYLQDLFAETRRQGNALRAYGWMNVHPVESNQVYIPKGSGSASVTMIGENVQKPSADQSYAQISVAIFTAAGISKQSKQLVMDSSPTVLDLSTRELGTLLGNLEEGKVINGSGSSEPLGILGTSGLAITPQTASDSVVGTVAASATQQDVIDQILNAVVAVTSSYYAPPNGCLMHPRRLGWLLQGKDTNNNYLFNRNGTFRQPNFDPAMQTVNSMSTAINTPPYDLFGLPIGTSTNIPTDSNYGVSGNSDQDVIIVGAWQEAHWFQRQDVTVDTTDVAGESWEYNQVWIRAEERFGFTAARYPNAFAVVSGKGLSAPA
jgi:HK97 family phage major capsid protein